MHAGFPWGALSWPQLYVTQTQKQLNAIVGYVGPVLKKTSKWYIMNGIKTIKSLLM